LDRKIAERMLAGTHWHSTDAFSHKPKGCPADLRGNVNHVAQKVYSSRVYHMLMCA
jgi:hypothetical protein